MQVSWWQHILDELKYPLLLALVALGLVLFAHHGYREQNEVEFGKYCLQKSGEFLAALLTLVTTKRWINGNGNGNGTSKDTPPSPPPQPQPPTQPAASELPPPKW
jgi:hypothetical protein